MDSNIAEEIDYNTSDSEPFHKVKLVNDGTLVKIEKTTNTNPLVLRLRYVDPNNEDTASNNNDGSQYPWEEASRTSVSEILNSGDHSMTIEEHKSLVNEHHETESHTSGLRRSHRTNNDQNGRKNYRKDLQEKLRITPDHFVSRRNPSDTTASTLHKEETVSITPQKTHEKAPQKKTQNEPKETHKTPKEQHVIQIKISPPVPVTPVIDKEAEEKQKATYKRACDHFGITHPLVQQHYKFIKSYFKEYVCSPYTFQQTCIDSLELKKSHKITKGFYLLKLGQPFIPGFSTRGDPQTSSAIEFYDGFVAFRKYASFLNPGFLVYYYQTIIYLEEISQYVFVMVPEDREELVLFHSSLVKLQEFIFNKIKEANKGTTMYRKYKSQKKDLRFPETSPLILRHKILSLYKLQSNFDTLLENMMQQVIGAGVVIATVADAENAEQAEKEKEKKEIFFNKVKKILADDHMTQTLKNLFKKKVDYSDLPKKVNFAEFFFGLSHPKGVLLHELLGKKQTLTFSQLRGKFKHHLTTISPYCQIKHLEIKLDDPESLGLGPTYKYQIERLLPDYSHPSQGVWFIFDVCSKVNVAEKTRQLCYSIHHTCQFKDELTTTGDTPENCLMKFLKKYTKSGASRRILLEWAERVFDHEIRSHENRDTVVETLMNMYSFAGEEEDFERSEEEMDMFDNLIEKKHPGLFEIDTENHSNPEEKKLAARGWEVRDCFESDANIVILDGKFVFTSEKMPEAGAQGT